MFQPENRIAFREIKGELGLWATLKCFASVVFKSLRVNYKTKKNINEIEKLKQGHKEHFKMVPLLYGELQKRLEQDEARDVMQSVIIKSGQAFVTGFASLGPDEKSLTNFIEVYKNFERNNIVFDVIEESEKKFEIKITRCLIYEAFKEFGAEDLAPCICDVATSYFSGYHPNIEYTKDRMIARGDETCHEIFIWRD